jgi:hypothetical protein
VKIWQHRLHLLRTRYVILSIYKVYIVVVVVGCPLWDVLRGLYGAIFLAKVADPLLGV